MAFVVANGRVRAKHLRMGLPFCQALVSALAITILL
jgi:hypothetical protein